MIPPVEHLREQLGSYRIVRELSAGRTFLALDEDDRQVVLKRLGEDCLLLGGRGPLHASIRERLARVRELAHPRVGQLCGVERIKDEGVFLVWKYIAGVTFEQWLSSEERGHKQVAAIGREIALGLEALHRLGIVHGAIHGRNIMVQDGRAVLIDFSPLLYSDPAEDATALATMLGPVLGDEMAGRIQGRSVTQMAAILGGSTGERPQGQQDDEARLIKRRAILGAAGAILVGGAAAAIIWWFTHGAAT